MILFKDWIQKHKQYFDVMAVIAIGLLLIGFGIGVTIYDNQLTPMFHEASDSGRPINWHGHYYLMHEVDSVFALNSSISGCLNCTEVLP